MAHAILAPKGISQKKEITCSHPCTLFLTTLYFILKPTIHQTRLRVCPARATSKRSTKEVAPCNPLLSLNTSLLNHSSTKRQPALAPKGFFISSHFYSLNHSSAKYGASHTCPARVSHKKRNNLFSTPHSILYHSVFYPQTNNPSNTPACLPRKGYFNFIFPPANTSLLNQPSAKYGACHTCPEKIFFTKEAAHPQPNL